VYAVLLILYLGGAVTTWVAATYSIKRRVVAGQDFGALEVFTWYAGWALAAAFTLGLATMIYVLTTREDIHATAARHSEVMEIVRGLTDPRSWRRAA